MDPSVGRVRRAEEVMELFGIGLPELFLILILALVVIGPERLPEVAGQFGRTVADLRRQATQLTSEFQSSLEDATRERQQQRTLSTAPPAGKVCPQCAVETAPEARFCPSCGANLAERTPDGEPRA
jgi:Tat protein translocase TatB subunit